MSDCVRGGHRNGKWSDRQEQASFKRNSRAFGQLDDVERSWRSLYRRSRSK